MGEPPNISPQRNADATTTPAGANNAVRSLLALQLCQPSETPQSNSVPFHALTADEALDVCQSSPSGLRQAEAAERRRRDGPNRLTPAKRRTLLHMALEQLANIIIAILVAAAVISAVFKEWIELGFIVAVIVANVIIGVVQEGKAEAATKAISKLVTASAVVMRNERRVTVEATELVVGDVVILAAGDRVPADLRLLSASDLRVVESALTGESTASSKHTEAVSAEALPGDRQNMAFMGTLVLGGDAVGLVVATGDRAEIGRINRLVSSVKTTRTPLQKQIAQFGLSLSVGCIIIVIVVFLVAFLARDEDIQHSLELAISVAVALIPEGLPTVVTITLALGVQTMARHKAIVRQLPAVETLGSITCICSDKTGTLTKNQMTVTEVHTSSDCFKVTGTGYHPYGEVNHDNGQTLTSEEARKLRDFLLPAALCNDATLMPVISAEAHKLLKYQPLHAVDSTAEEGLEAEPLTASNAAVESLSASLTKSNQEPSSPSGGMARRTSYSRLLNKEDDGRVTELYNKSTLAEQQTFGDSGNDLAEDPDGLGDGVSPDNPVKASRSSSITSSSDSASTNSSATPTDVGLLTPAVDPAQRANAPLSAVPPTRAVTSLGSPGGSADNAAAAADSATVLARTIEWCTTGDPTEAALLAVAMKAGLNYRTLHVLARSAPRLASVPFSSDLKFMATVHDMPDPHHRRHQRRMLLVKGAAEALLPHCNSQAVGLDCSKKEPLQMEKWQKLTAELAKQGMRVLALCQRELPKRHARSNVGIGSDTILADPPSLQLNGLVAMVDPPREEAIRAVESCHTAGITVKMITGDHAATAATVGRWIGIKTTEVITGAQLSVMDDATLELRAEGCNIFARTSPEHKLRIVKALQRRAQVVAMTGDGVNDAPALRQADVGVAMGLAGTEVAKEASRIILQDDNFATFKEAVQLGRGTYDNLRKLMMFLLPTTVAQGFSVALSVFMGVPSPLTSVQILYVNMVTAATLGLVLAVEPPEEGVMTRPPRRVGKPLVGKLIAFRTIFVGAAMIAAVMGQQAWTRAIGGSREKGRTVAMNTLVISQCLYLISCRFIRKSSLSWNGVFGNRWLIVMVFVNIGLQALLTYTPGLQTAMSTKGIGILSWLRIVLFAVVIFLLVELQKKFSPWATRYVFEPLFNWLGEVCCGWRRRMRRAPANVDLMAAADTTSPANAAMAAAEQELTGVGSVGATPQPLVPAASVSPGPGQGQAVSGEPRRLSLSSSYSSSTRVSVV